MLTNVLTPTAAEACNTLAVPSTFVFHPSSGYCSSIGKCFSAAAWNTTSGLSRSKWACTTDPSRMSHRTRSGLSINARPWMDNSTACSADSSRSSMINWLGPKRFTWRHNSEPIDPPAPVINTRRLCRICAIESSSRSTERRPKRSVTSRSRRSRNPMWSRSICVIPGTTFTSRPHA